MSAETGTGDKDCSSWKRVGTFLGLALALVVAVGLALNILLPWSYLRTGILYFRQDEALGLFLVAFGVLAVLGRKHPEWHLERLFLRLVISLTSIGALGGLVAIFSRDFAILILWVFSFLMLCWMAFDRFWREALICGSILIGLLVIPVDIALESPYRSTDGRESSIRWLKAGYGLVRYPGQDPDYYNLGCVVPPNRLQWVLYIDFWPAIDHTFLAFDRLLNINVRSTDAD